MNHRRRSPRLQRKTAHRKALLANMSMSLIEHGRIRTTVAKAKALRPYVEKLVTLGKRDSVHTRRRAMSILGTCQQSAKMVNGKAVPNRQRRAVQRLFTEISPTFEERQGGYTRITKVGPRMSDSAPMAYIEWVDYIMPEDGEE